MTNAGHGHLEIHESHGGPLKKRPGIAGQDSEGDTDSGANDHCCDPDPERRAEPEKQPAQEITANLVGAEDMATAQPAGAQQAVEHHCLGRVSRREELGEDRCKCRRRKNTQRNCCAETDAGYAPRDPAGCGSYGQGAVAHCHVSPLPPPGSVGRRRHRRYP